MFGYKQIALLVVAVLMILLGLFSWLVYQSQKPVKLSSIADTETLLLSGGKSIKFVGIKASGSGTLNPNLVKEYLAILLMNKNVWLEYEGLRQDQAWVWVGCESMPRFWVFRQKGENPFGCLSGVLVNEQLVKMGWSKEYFVVEGRGTKYENRLY